MKDKEERGDLADPDQGRTKSLISIIERTAERRIESIAREADHLEGEVKRAQNQERESTRSQKRRNSQKSIL